MSEFVPHKIDAGEESFESALLVDVKAGFPLSAEDITREVGPYQIAC